MKSVILSLNWIRFESKPPFCKSCLVNDNDRITTLGQRLSSAFKEDLEVLLKRLKLKPSERWEIGSDKHWMVKEIIYLAKKEKLMDKI